MKEEGITESTGLVSVPGGRIWYRVMGEDRTGIPLLALHGGPGAAHFYLQTLGALADERPVIFYDQLGCGNSDRPDDLSLWTVQRFVEELDGVRQALNLGRVHIFGQSWGTMLAVDYLLTLRPRGVASLVLAGPCLSVSRFIADQRAYIQDFPEKIRRAVEVAEARKEFDSAEYQEAMMAFYRRHVCRLDPWPDCLQQTVEGLNQAVYRHMWGPSEFTVTGVLRDYERVGRLREINIPVLFTCGRYDEASPATTAYYSAELPGSELAVIEDSSHEHHLEKPEQFVAVVRDFLHRCE
ncbi:MAG: proline iminopeptidase-family hydrolase [Syntrophobacteraceae bacterium]|nr:proline iminopeptidase-family hydrolase [Syntrophobacteraceae bacterium]